MPLFVCDKCHAIEDTIAGLYWTRGKNPALCSECMPESYESSFGRGGNWHGLFEKQIATPELIKKIGEENFVYVSNIEGVKAKI